MRAPPGTKNATAYTPTSGSNVDWHVGVIAESEGYGMSAKQGWRPTATFPAGMYDGVGYPTIIDKSGKRRRVKVTVEEESDNESDDVIDEKAHLLHGYAM